MSFKHLSGVSRRVAFKCEARPWCQATLCADRQQNVTFGVSKNPPGAIGGARLQEIDRAIQTRCAQTTAVPARGPRVEMSYAKAGSWIPAPLAPQELAPRSMNCTFSNRNAKVCHVGRGVLASSGFHRNRPLVAEWYAFFDGIASGLCSGSGVLARCRCRKNPPACTP